MADNVYNDDNNARIENAHFLNPDLPADTAKRKR